MFEKLNKTSWPPQKPLMVYDGSCGFCHYWVLRWSIMTGDLIDYEPYQDVHQNFKDIRKRHFEEAGRLIEPDGTIYTGAAAAYRACFLAGKSKWLWKAYQKIAWFRKLNDAAYDYIAQHRPFMMKVTSLAFGKNPRDPKPYWAAFLVIFLILLSAIRNLSRHR